MGIRSLKSGLHCKEHFKQNSNGEMEWESIEGSDEEQCIFSNVIDAVLKVFKFALSRLNKRRSGKIVLAESSMGSYMASKFRDQGFEKILESGRRGGGLHRSFKRLIVECQEHGSPLLLIPFIDNGHWILILV